MQHPVVWKFVPEVTTRHRQRTKELTKGTLAPLLHDCDLSKVNASLPLAWVIFVTVYVIMWYEISTLWRIWISVCISHQQQAEGDWMVAGIINLWSPWQTRAPYIYIYIWTHIYIHSMYTFPYSLWFLFLQLLTTCLFLCEKTSQAFSIMANISAMLLKTGLGEKGTAMDARWNNKAIDEMVSRQEIYVYLPHGLK